LLELLLLELDLVVLLFAVLFFAPPDFEAAFAMLLLLPAPYNSPAGTAVPDTPNTPKRSPLVLLEQIGYEYLPRAELGRR
jgi:hypothetical protein